VVLGVFFKVRFVLQETARRFLHFTVPRVVAVSPQMRLVEDNPSSISLLDVLRQGCAALQIEHETPIARYYERLASIQARGAQVCIYLQLFLVELQRVVAG